MGTSCDTLTPLLAASGLGFGAVLQDVTLQELVPNRKMASFPTGNGDLSNKHSWLVVELTYPSEK